MRIVVVLPLPLAPRKPQISPATCNVRPSTTLRAEAFPQIVDVDDEVRSWRYNQRVGVLCDRHFNLHGKIALSLGPLIK